MTSVTIAFPDNGYPKGRHCPFDRVHSDSLFGFLADVRNYSEAPVAELSAFDYDQTFIDQWNDGDGNPKVTSVRDFLGDWHFTRLDLLGKLGAPEDVRIAFWFDN